jgi:lysozyme
MVNSPQALIEFEEGRRHDAYQDSLGYWTNGIGHRYTDNACHEGETWSDAKVDAVFALDYERAESGIRAYLSWFDRLDPVRQAYLVSMAFQLGVAGAMQFKNTLSALRDERWNDAAGGVRASLWHKQTFLRAERCARAFETGAWQS